MKILFGGTLIAVVAMTGTAFAFGPGYQSNQQLAQNNAQFQMQRPGFRQGVAPGTGRRMAFNQTQSNQFPNRGNRTGQPVFMDSWDSNEDGTVSLAEAKARRGEYFSALDDDDDGKLDTKEFKTFLTNQKMPLDQATNRQRGLLGMNLAFNDVNKDGIVTRKEFLAQTSSWLKRMDISGDGKVTSADFGPGNGRLAANRRNNQNWMQGRGPGRGMGRGQGRGRGLGMGQGQGRGQGRGMGMRWQ